MITHRCQWRISFHYHVIITQPSLAPKLRRYFLPFFLLVLPPPSFPSLHSPTTSFFITFSSHTVHRLLVLCKSGPLISRHLGLIATTATTVRLRLYPPYLYSARQLSPGHHTSLGCIPAVGGTSLASTVNAACAVVKRSRSASLRYCKARAI